MSLEAQTQPTLPGIPSPTVKSRKAADPGAIELRRFMEKFQHKYLTTMGAPLGPDVAESLKTHYLNWKSITRVGMVKGEGGTRGALAVLSPIDAERGNFRVDALIVNASRGMIARSGPVDLSRTEASESATVALSAWISRPATRKENTAEAQTAAADSPLPLALRDANRSAQAFAVKGFERVVAAAERDNGLVPGSIAYEPFVARKFAEVNCKELAESLTQKSAQLVRALDQDLWRAASRSKEPLSAMELVAESRTDTQRTYRAQAVESFPWLPWKSIASHAKAGSSEGLAGRIVKTIDEGDSMKRFLNETFGVPKPLYKRLTNKTVEDLGERFFDDPFRSIQFAATIDPNHLPANVQEWDAFSSMAKPLVEIAEAIGSPPKVLLNGLLKPKQGMTWLNLEDRVAAASEQHTSKGFLPFLANGVKEAAARLEQVLGSIADKERVAIAGSASAGEALMPQIFAGKRLDAVAKLEGVWRVKHTEALIAADDRAEEEIAQGAATEERWPGLIKGKSVALTIDGEKRYAEELTSSDALRAEGTRMHHCVGTYGYAGRCAAAQVRIFSLKASPHAKGESTLELTQGGRHQEAGEWSFVQNRGKHNHVPAAWALQLGERLVEGINDGSIPNRRQSLAVALEASRGNTPARVIQDRREVLVQKYYADRLSDTAEDFMPKKFSGKTMADFATASSTLEAVGGKVMKTRVAMLF